MLNSRRFDMAQVSFFLFPVLVTCAAMTDLFSMKIPNWLSIVLILAFFVLASAIGFDSATMVNHLVAGLLALLIGFGLFVSGSIGGGDAKFSVAIALWLGLGKSLSDFALISALGGGALTLLLLVLRRLHLPDFALTWTWLQRLHDKRTGVPYGIALAGAALSVFFQSPVAIEFFRIFR